MISEHVYKCDRDKNNRIQFARPYRIRARRCPASRRLKFPMCGTACYQGNPSSGASVAHQPSASRYRTAQLAERVPRRDAARRSAIPRCLANGFRECVARCCVAFAPRSADRSTENPRSEEESEATPSSPLVPSARFRPARGNRLESLL